MNVVVVMIHVPSHENVLRIAHLRTVSPTTTCTFSGISDCCASSMEWICELEEITDDIASYVAK